MYGCSMLKSCPVVDIFTVILLCCLPNSACRNSNNSLTTKVIPIIILLVESLASLSTYKIYGVMLKNAITIAVAFLVCLFELFQYVMLVFSLASMLV